MKGPPAPDLFESGDEPEAARVPAIARQAPALNDAHPTGTALVPVAPFLPALHSPTLSWEPATWRLARFAWTLKAASYLCAVAISIFVLAGSTLAILGIGPFDGVSRSSYLPGAVLFFGDAGNAGEFLEDGWGPRDEDGRWTNHSVSQMTVPLNSTEVRYVRMEIHFATRVDMRDPLIDVQILANGNTIFRRSYTTSRLQTAQLTFPISDRAPRESIQLTFVQDSPLNSNFEDGGTGLHIEHLSLKPTTAGRFSVGAAKARAALRP